MIANRLLIADDEPNVAGFIGWVAKSCGYEVQIASDAASLERALVGFHATHIILDLRMPGLDGIQVLRRLAELKCCAKIVIFSGADPKVLEAARRFGVESGLAVARTLSKPVGSAELRRVLEDLKDDAGWLTTETLQHAIDAGQLFLEYQPKLVLPSRSFAGAEALVRWAHPERGRIPPNEFLPLAESSTLINELTSFVVRAALSQIAGWQRSGMECPVSINLSSRNIHELDFADRLAEECSSIGVSPGLVTLELTESAAMEDPRNAIDILTRLRIKGFRLSIDDFGTGYSSLVQLHRLPFSELKIDRSFVLECGASRDALVIVRTMVDLAHNLGLTVCAEGVENEDVVRLLEELGCDSLQGFHIARPMDADRLPGWARDRPAAMRQAG
jgi:EAL domain-containing protein (putative c-di-GMP-specific phosphodiesterase class I)/ActR/RegA family two-component response regulator